jgi:hypothetical protein
MSVLPGPLRVNPSESAQGQVLLVIGHSGVVAFVPVSRSTVKPSSRSGHGNRLLGEASDRFRESRAEITISGRLFQKSDGNSQFPDRFGKSCPAIGKAGRNLKKLSNICEKSDGNWKFQTEILKSQTAFWISV